MADRFSPGANEDAEPEPILIGDDDEGSEEEAEDGSDEEYEPSGGESENGGDFGGEKRKRTVAEEAGSPEGSSQEKDSNLGDVDGLFCPICMEAWTSEGDHHICCLPCGHLYGLSCINRWLKQRKNHGKCPQCNSKCTLKDVRKLFASQIVAIDEKLQKRIRSLEAKCALLQKQRADWKIKEANWKKLEAGLQSKCLELIERTTYLESLMGDLSYGKSANGAEVDSDSSKESSCEFMLQEEFQVDGAHLFDVDISDKILLFARSPPGMGAKDILTKVSLIHPLESEDIFLPPSTNIIKDLRFSPSNDRLALLASLGKKLSLLSMDSKSVVLSYDVPAAAWSCSWDLNNSHYVYVGLQNGSVFMFDKRQTSGPVKFLMGRTSSPVHTIHSLSNDSNAPSGQRPSILSASSGGLSEWNFEGGDEWPTVVPGTNAQGVCISLAYCPSSDDIVASYRPRVEMPNESATSQPSRAPSRVIRQGVSGCHFQYRRACGRCFQTLSSASARVDPIRLPKSVIMDTGDDKLFAYRDERTSDLNLQQLPDFSDIQSLESNGRPLRDIKYTNALGHGFLGCLSGETLQIFKIELSS